MLIKFLAVAAALVLVACGTAWAAPTTVQLRIEGTTGTVFEGPVTTDGKTITKGGHTVVCDGTLNNANPAPGPTATSALDDAALANGFDWDASFFGDFFVTTIGGVTSTTWGFAIDLQQAPVGGCQQQVHAGEEVLFASEFFAGPMFGQLPLLKLDGPPRAATGQQFAVKVTDGIGDSVSGATVGGAQTGADGAVSLTVGAPGLVRLKAEKAGTIRSNAVNVCVSETGTGDCGVPPSQLGGTAGRLVKDSVAPRGRISRPIHGKHYRRGPRLLTGTARDETGVTKVELALRSHVRGKQCRWWSGSRERFAGGSCAKPVFFTIEGGTRWSYLLPRRLQAGRYTLYVKALDRAGNVDERFVRGSNRAVFYVGRRYAARARVARRRGAHVDVLLAGRSKSYEAAVRARPALVKVGGRKCRVGARTPLAALAALLRERRVGYRIQDYGRCSRTTAAASGQLFVRRIGPDSNRGNDGWFYKVNDRAPEVGAGDLSARARAGDRILWFYCLFDEHARSCQRSLRVVPGTAAGSTGKPLRVTVRGYDNAGRSIPVGGATVSLGAVTAVTGADGRASVVPGRAGRYVLAARKDGMVDSFPIAVAVR